MFAGVLAVFLDAAVQYKIGVFQRLIVNQPVQLRAVKAAVCDFVLHGSAVDGDCAAVCEKQLHAARVDIELAGNNIVNVENLRQV